MFPDNKTNLPRPNTGRNTGRVDSVTKPIDVYLERAIKSGLTGKAAEEDAKLRRAQARAESKMPEPHARASHVPGPINRPLRGPIEARNVAKDAEIVADCLAECFPNHQRGTTFPRYVKGFTGGLVPVEVNYKQTWTLQPGEGRVHIAQPEATNPIMEVHCTTPGAWGHPIYESDNVAANPVSYWYKNYPRPQVTDGNTYFGEFAWPKNPVDVASGRPSGDTNIFKSAMVLMGGSYTAQVHVPYNGQGRFAALGPADNPELIGTHTGDACDDYYFLQPSAFHRKYFERGRILDDWNWTPSTLMDQIGADVIVGATEDSSKVYHWNFHTANRVAAPSAAPFGDLSIVTRAANPGGPGTVPGPTISLADLSMYPHIYPTHQPGNLISCAQGAFFSFNPLGSGVDIQVTISLRCHYLVACDELLTSIMLPIIEDTADRYTDEGDYLARHHVHQSGKGEDYYKVVQAVDRSDASRMPELINNELGRDVAHILDSVKPADPIGSGGMVEDVEDPLTWIAEASKKGAEVAATTMKTAEAIAPFLSMFA